MSDDLRFPIGNFKPSGDFDPADRTQHIETIRLLPAKMRAAVAGLSEAQIDTPYREGGWTVRQVVHHVADSHINSYVRFKLALTEDSPTIKPYDEGAWAVLADTRLPVETSLTLLDALHRRWTVMFESMSESDFQKVFNHPERGAQTLAVALALYAWHSKHHTAHITSLRQRQGW